MTGPNTPTRHIVYARAGNACELCGVFAYGGSVHHRRRRGMGGTRRPELNLPGNLILLCGSGTTGCHGRVEKRHEPIDGLDPYAAGLLLHDHETPADTPVRLRDPFTSGWRWVLLADDGSITPTERPEGVLL